MSTHRDQVKKGIVVINVLVLPFCRVCFDEQQPSRQAGIEIARHLATVTKTVNRESIHDSRARERLGNGSGKAESAQAFARSRENIRRLRKCEIKIFPLAYGMQLNTTVDLGKSGGE
eukprot:GHVU01148223.1.p7 GENE.GHVU01148223.1~~GHVU01148223.1.p7  ORF type:complete len:117 (+),score=6.70 GHVU01148223.1:439-789(+)